MIKRTPNQLIRHTQATINRAFKLQNKLHIRITEINDLMNMLDGLVSHLNLLIKDFKHKKNDDK